MPERDYTQVGPPLGEPFPDVVLPDQTGRNVDLHRERRGRKALVVFHRSARW
jgi:peroxiredoxin